MAKKTEENPEIEAIGHEPRSYEFAYLLDPAIAPDSLSGVVGEITSIVENNNGTLGTSEAPRSLRLAYPVVLAEGGKRSTYTSAHFGWLRFTATGGDAVAIEKTVNESDKVLRTLMIFAEDYAAGRVMPTHRKTREVATEKPSEEVLDKQVDDLIAQTEKDAEKATETSKEEVAA